MNPPDYLLGAQAPKNHQQNGQRQKSYLLVLKS